MAATSRRDFLAGTLGVAGAALGLGACSTPTAGGRPVRIPVRSAAPADAPNLVVILSDDHRFDLLGRTGAAPFLRTPALDRLADQGLTMAQAFCTTALCSPSRATLLTGTYPRRHGVINNVSAWDPSTTSVFEPLAAAGYRNAFIGKWHMPGALPDLRGVERFVTFTVDGGQGRYVDCPLVMDGVETQRPGTYVTTDLTDLALEFLADQDARAPFCLYLAHKAVHHPFVPPADLRGTYDDVDLSSLPPESFTWQTLLERNVWEGTAGRLDVAYRRYCETLLGMDREIGRLLAALEALGPARSTAVVYLSDNGYSWGEHALTGKRWAYEENMRVPMIVRWPGGIPDPGATREQIALTVDLAPTLLDLAGLDRPASMQGASLVPALRQADAPGRAEVYFEYFEDFPYNTPPLQALRTDRWLYVEYDRGLGPELYDLAADPRQQVNLIDTPAATTVVPGLSARLNDLRAANA